MGADIGLRWQIAAAPAAARAERAAHMQGHHNVIYRSAPVHATLAAQPAAGADALKDLRARTRAQEIL